MYDIYEEIAGAVDEAGITRAAERRLTSLGFEHFACFSFVPGAKIQYHVSRHLRLRDYVMQRAYLDDPIIHKAAENVTPFVWNAERWDTPLRDQERAVLRQLREIEVERGVALPVHGPGMAYTVLCCSSHKPIEKLRNLPDDVRANLQALAVHLASRYRQVCNGVPETPTLTPRERECLLWTADGKTAADIAVIVSISTRTAQFHISNAMHKLDAASKLQAVLKAYSLGLLN
jgi:DNA-binding CsgD family transcriptional regulator